MTTPATAPLADRPAGPVAWSHRVEDLFLILVLAAMAVLPLVDALLRGLFHTAVPGGVDLVRHGTLWVAFAGAALAAREGRHLGFAGEVSKRLGRTGELAARAFSGALATAVVLALAYAAALLIRSEQDGAATIGGYLPIWVAILVVPITLLLLGGRLIWEHGDTWKARLLILGLAGLVLAVGLVPAGAREWLFWPGIAVLLLAGVTGAPIFSVLGGLALLLFFVAAEPDADYAPIIAIPTAAYEIVTIPSSRRSRCSPWRAPCWPRAGPPSG